MDVMELIVDALRNAGIGCEPNGDVIFVDGGDGKNYSLTVEECEGEDDEGEDDWAVCADCGKSFDPDKGKLLDGNPPIWLCPKCFAQREKDDEETALRDPEDFEKNRHTTED